MVEDLQHPFLGLIDSGALHNRFARWIADEAGIDLQDAHEGSLAVGGFATTSLTVMARLTVGGIQWEAPVGFCDPWPLDFQLLGQEGFFRWFEVAIRAARYTLDLTPELE